MKPTRDQVIEWWREAGLAGLGPESDMTYLMRLVDRIFAAGQASAAQGVEPVAWISEIQCVGPEYKKKLYGARPIQSLQAGYYKHTPLYTAPPTAAAIEAQVKEACAKVCEENAETAKQLAEEFKEEGGVYTEKRYAHEMDADAIRSMPPMFSGAQSKAAIDVLSERRRQVEAEGWTPEHDDEHDGGQMAVAAGYYALACGFPHERDIGCGHIPQYWPWAREWWKPRDPRSNLVKAAALILAEIERLDRAMLAAAPEVK